MAALILRRAMLNGRAVASLWQGSQLLDLLVDAPSPAPGQVFGGRVTRLLPRQGGAFLDLGGITGFLPDAAGLREGERLVVAVLRPPDGDKAAMLTRHPDFPGQWLVHTPTKPGVNLSKKITDSDHRARLTKLLAGFDGLVVRTHAATADPAALLAEATALRDHARALLTRPGIGLLGEAASLQARLQALWPQAQPGDDAPPEALEQALVAARALPLAIGGGLVHIEPTAALVAIDVNTTGSPAQVNQALAAELPRLLRLRGLGGIITIDFAPMADLRPVLTTLQRALAGCPVPTQLHGVGPAGLVELTRRQDRLATKNLLKALS